MRLGTRQVPLRTALLRNEVTRPLAGATRGRRDGLLGRYDPGGGRRRQVRDESVQVRDRYRPVREIDTSLELLHGEDVLGEPGRQRPDHRLPAVFQSHE